MFDSHSNLFRSVTALRNAVLITCLFGPLLSAQPPGLSRTQDASIPVVALSVIFADKSDHSVDDVSRDDLQVFEDGKLQELHSFSREEKAVKYTILIDTSLSFRNLLDAALFGSKLIIEQNRLDDETRLVRFVSSDKITVEQEFTSDRSKLLDVLRLLRPEPGKSAVIDAVYMTVESRRGNKDADPVARRAVVVISDGEDRDSYHTRDALVELLRQSEVKVFVIGMVSELDEGEGLIGKTPRTKAEELLKLLARETGGRVFFPRKVGELRSAAKEIAHDLHIQFSVSYLATGPGVQGFHKVQIKSAQKALTGITRSGYFGPRPNAREAKKSSP